MKKTNKSIGLLALLFLMGTSLFAQKGVWVPAGGNIEGFQITTGTYKNSLYVCGVDYKSPMPKTYIKKFNGVFWSTLIEIPGYNNSISSMKEYNGELYIGGQFIEFAGVKNANSLVKWNGSNWSAVGAGFDKSFGPQVRSMEVFNNKLYIAGRFDSIAGVQVKNIAVWNGSAYSAGPICESSAGMYTIVQSLKTFNSNLYIGGSFETVNTKNCKNIARFDGTNVYAMSNGANNGTNSEVSGLEVHNSELYLYGYFSQLDTISVNGIAKWDNSLLKKLVAEPSGNIQSLKSHGNELYSSGAGFNSSIEFFNGSKWDDAGNTKLTGEGSKLVSFQNRLYVFGGFLSSDSSNFVFEGSAMLIDNSDACKVEGVVYLDSDKSCKQNNGEKGIQKRIVEIKPVGVKMFTDSLGYFSMYLEKGSYSLKLLPYPYYASTCTDSIAFTFSNKGDKTDTLFFGTYVKDTVLDGAVKLTSSNARPGFNMQYCLTATNKGTASQNCTIKLVLDNNFEYSSLNGKPYTRFSGNLMEWDIVAFAPNSMITVYVLGKVKIGTAIGTKMATSVQLVPAVSDANLNNNFDTAFNYVRSSFDPNDKQVYPLGKGSEGFIGKNTSQSLRYHIRFQNTGNDTAFNIVVTDSLSNDLDVSTFEEVGGSHPYTYEFLPGNVLKFSFQNILLLDSNTNEALSHGYITFNIKPKKGLSVGSKIRNNADIYFDFNEPVRTNTIVTTFDDLASVKRVNFANNQLKIYPNPGTGVANIELDQPLNSNETVTVEITDLYGKIIQQTIWNDVNIQLDLSGMNNMVYIIKVRRSSGETLTGRYLKLN
jgi:uncharacterized repeat protein (TIGR01451 family)